uniref:Pyrimidine nucleoside phosphorylase C-terminal domain-containing protein n=1 Tax=Anopheles coluzzii TaxID=1518534 RepID=A0A8W7P8E0_ANOCL
MDVKAGSGAFMPSMEASIALAERIVQVGNGAGVRTSALITDMSQPLASAAGNSLETAEAIRYLKGEQRNPRLHAITMALCSEMLLAGGLAASDDDACKQLEQALGSGRAAEIFARMVAELGGPADLLEHHPRYLPAAPVLRPVYAEHRGFVSAMDTRALGMAVCALGGGRRLASDQLDYRVGLTQFVELGQWVAADQPLLLIHAADERGADEAARRIRSAISLSEAAPAALPLVYQTIHRR